MLKFLKLHIPKLFLVSNYISHQKVTTKFLPLSNKLSLEKLFRFFLSEKHQCIKNKVTPMNILGLPCGADLCFIHFPASFIFQTSLPVWNKRVTKAKKSRCSLKTNLFHSLALNCDLDLLFNLDWDI